MPTARYMQLLFADYATFSFPPPGTDLIQSARQWREEKMVALLRQWRKTLDPQDGAFGSFIKDALSIFDLLGQISFSHPRIFSRPPAQYVMYHTCTTCTSNHKKRIILNLAFHPLASFKAPKFSRGAISLKKTISTFRITS